MSAARRENGSGGWRRAITALALAAGLAVPAHGGGPLSLVNDQPVVYPNGGSSLTLNVDQGPLGTRTNAQAIALVQNAVAMWNGVGTSTLRIAIGSPLPADYTTANYADVYGKYFDGLNPVIFDTDGSITDLLFGVGAKASVLGFAGSAYYTAGSSAGTYAEGQAVLNGSIGIGDATWTNVLAHEIGHFFGLDHSQLDSTQGLPTDDYVLMYPIAYRTLQSLHEDDVAAVTSLYPAASAGSVYGQIAGTFTTAAGAPILGANIWARETSTGDVFSVVSDFLTQGNGYFRLLLPAGTYTLNAESIAVNFSGGSGIGPHADTASSASFLPPHPITPVALGGAAPQQIAISAGCSATATFRLDGTGGVSGNCGGPTPATTSTSLASSANPASAGASLTLTATVTGSAPTGTVNFRDGAASIGGCSAVTLAGTGNSRTASCTTSALAAGTHSLVAAYGGDAGNAASTSATLSQVINPVSTPSANVALASAGAVATASSTYEYSYPANAVNNNQRSGAGFGSGGGSWRDGSRYTFPDWVQISFNGAKTIDRVVLYTVQDNSTSAVEPTDTLTFTRYGITAFAVQTWNGSAWVTQAAVSGNNRVKRTITFGAVTTDRIRINVNASVDGWSRITEIEAWSASSTTSPVATSTVLASSVNPAAAGTSITLTATVAGSAPTGTVNFRDGAASIGGCSAVTLAGTGNSRTASCTTSALAAGTHSLVAAYGGDAGNATSTSAALSQVINAPPAGGSSVALASSANPASAGASLTLTATVTGSAPTGTVNFRDGAASIGGCSAVTLAGTGNSRTASCTTSALAAGTHSLVAAYGGDAGNAASTSATLSQVINPVSTLSANVALASAGAVATASSTYEYSYPANAVNNNQRSGAGFGSGGGSWRDGSRYTFPDWVQISFNGAKTINRVVLYTVQDNSTSAVEPTDTLTFTRYGITAFAVQTWNGSAWVTQAAVSGNNRVKRTITFGAVTTDRIRINVNASVDGWSRITEIEAWSN